MVRDRAEKIARVDLRKAAPATGSQQGVVVYRARFAGGPRDFFALRPLDFDRRQTEKQWAWKISLLSDSRLAYGLLGGDVGQALRQSRRGERLDLDEVYGAGDTRLQSVGREVASAAPVAAV